MKSFIQFITERLQSPEKVLQRAARRYGSKMKGSFKDPEFGKLDKSKLIPLKKYDAKFANSAFDKYDRLDKSYTTRENVDLNIHDLHPGQKYVNVSDPKKLQQKVTSKTDHIFVVKHKGKHVVLDGHHAIYAAWARGEKTIKATHYVDMDKE